MDDLDRVASRSVFSCPDCGGVMWEIDEDDHTRFRCHTGHAYTAELMSLAQDEVLRRALAAARRGFHERVRLMQKMEGQALESGRTGLAAIWRKRLDEYQEQADVIDGALRGLERLTFQLDE